MGKIIAIGGGNIGSCDAEYETAPFDKEIVRLSGKVSPRFLFIGLANIRPDDYFKRIDDVYTRMYNCKTDHLRYNEIKNEKIAMQKIQNADIVYIGGGNTYKLMRLLKLYGIDKMLLNAYNDNKVLCGVSAGGICWCNYGNSCSRTVSSNSSQMIRVTGLGLVNILFAPHISKEPQRANSVKQMMKRTYKIPAVQLDKAALEIVDDQYRILTIDKNSIAEKCFWKNGKYFTKSIINNGFQNIENLYKK